MKLLMNLWNTLVEWAEEIHEYRSKQKYHAWY